MRIRRFLILAAAVVAFVSADAEMAVAQKSSNPRPSAEAQKREEVNANVIGLVAGQLEGAPIRLATEIARVVDEGSQMHVLPIVTRGPAENLDALLYLRGVDLAIVSADILGQFREKAPNLRSRLSYILNLFPSEAHVLVRPGIDSLEDLRGKKVNFNTEGTAAAFSGPLIFDRLGVDVEKMFIPHPAAIEQMQSGDVDAVFFITSKPVDVFLKKRFPAGYKFVPIPYDDRLSDSYVPAVLDHADYPALIPEGSDVQTISVPTILVAFNWQPNSDRYRRLSRFVNSLFDNVERLQSPGFDSKWRSINLAATVPSLNRFPAAQEWLSRTSPQASDIEAGPAINVNAAREQVGRITRLPLADQERLLRDFLRWARAKR